MKGKGKDPGFDRKQWCMDKWRQILLHVVVLTGSRANAVLWKKMIGSSSPFLNGSHPLKVIAVQIKAHNTFPCAFFQILTRGLIVLIPNNFTICNWWMPLCFFNVLNVLIGISVTLRSRSKLFHGIRWHLTYCKFYTVLRTSFIYAVSLWIF